MAPAPAPANFSLFPQSPGVSQYSYPSYTMTPFAIPSTSQADITHIQRAMEPIGTVSDDMALVVALRDATRSYITYDQAINRLHGTHNHTAEQWRSYYLDNKSRIDYQLSQYRDSSMSTMAYQSSIFNSPGCSSSPFTKNEKQRRDHLVSPSPPTPHSRTQFQPNRSTNNSISAFVDSGKEFVQKSSKSPDRRFTRRKLKYNIPDLSDSPPSREPSPPVSNIPISGSNRYTEEELDYFFCLMTYELRRNPELTKTEFVNRLVKKVPRHTAPSWMYKFASLPGAADYWDALCNFTQFEGNESITGQVVDAEDEDVHMQDDEEDRDYSVDTARTTSEDEDGTEEERPIGSRGPLMKDELHCLAKWIADNPIWSSITTSQRWDLFLSVYPSKRSKYSWAQQFRHNKQGILELVERYKAHRGAQ